MSYRDNEVGKVGSKCSKGALKRLLNKNPKVRNRTEWQMKGRTFQNSR